jgi:hypothetical protein
LERVESDDSRAVHRRVEIKYLGLKGIVGYGKSEE